MTPLSSQDLEALKALAEDAAPVPWADDMAAYYKAVRPMLPRLLSHITALEAEKAEARAVKGWKPGPLWHMHELKTVSPFFDDVLAGRKPFEVRKHDRCFRPGDVLHLREWRANTERYSGRECYVGVTYLLQGGQFGIDIEHCVLGITAPASNPEFLRALPAKRDETIEECARLAEAMQFPEASKCLPTPRRGFELAQRKIAAAILALKERT